MTMIWIIKIIFGCIIHYSINNMNHDAVKDGSNNDDDNLNNELSSMNIDSSHRSSNRNCLYCLQKVEGCSRCSKCRTALYCNRACQEKHWPVHKNICIDSNNTEDSNEKIHLKAVNHLDQGKRKYQIVLPLLI